MAKKTGYIVTEANFEYNDEYYSQQEGGKALKVYLDQASAKKEANKRELAALKHQYFRYSDYVSENSGHSADADEKFLEAYFKMVNTKRHAKTGVPPEIVNAMTTIESEIHVKWSGKKGNGDIRILGKEIDTVKRMLDTATNYTLTLPSGKSCDLFFIQHAIAMVNGYNEKKMQVEQEYKSRDLWDTRDMVKFDKLTDEQILELIPLMPITFFDVTPIEVE